MGRVKILEYGLKLTINEARWVRELLIAEIEKQDHIMSPYSLKKSRQLNSLRLRLKTYEKFLRDKYEKKKEKTGKTNTVAIARMANKTIEGAIFSESR